MPRKYGKKLRKEKASTHTDISFKFKAIVLPHQSILRPSEDGLTRKTVTSLLGLASHHSGKERANAWKVLRALALKTDEDSAAAAVLGDLLPSLIRASLDALCDEEADVRRLAGLFVRQVLLAQYIALDAWTSRAVLHFSKGLVGLLTHRFPSTRACGLLALYCLLHSRVPLSTGLQWEEVLGAGVLHALASVLSARSMPQMWVGFAAVVSGQPDDSRRKRARSRTESKRQQRTQSRSAGKSGGGSLPASYLSFLTVLGATVHTVCRVLLCSTASAHYPPALLMSCTSTPCLPLSAVMPGTDRTVKCFDGCTHHYPPPGCATHTPTSPPRRLSVWDLLWISCAGRQAASSGFQSACRAMLDRLVGVCVFANRYREENQVYDEVLVRRKRVKPGRSTHRTAKRYKGGDMVQTDMTVFTKDGQVVDPSRMSGESRSPYHAFKRLVQRVQRSGDNSGDNRGRIGDKRGRDIGTSNNPNNPNNPDNETAGHRSVVLTSLAEVMDRLFLWTGYKEGSVEMKAQSDYALFHGFNDVISGSNGGVDSNTKHTTLPNLAYVAQRNELQSALDVFLWCVCSGLVDVSVEIAQQSCKATRDSVDVCVRSYVGCLSLALPVVAAGAVAGDSLKHSDSLPFQRGKAWLTQLSQTARTLCLQCCVRLDNIVDFVNIHRVGGDVMAAGVISAGQVAALAPSDQRWLSGYARYVASLTADFSQTPRHHAKLKVQADALGMSGAVLLASAYPDISSHAGVFAISDAVRQYVQQHVTTRRIYERAVQSAVGMLILRRAGALSDDVNRENGDFRRLSAALAQLTYSGGNISDNSEQKHHQELKISTDDIVVKHSHSIRTVLSSQAFGLGFVLADLIGATDDVGAMMVHAATRLLARLCRVLRSGQREQAVLVLVAGLVKFIVGRLRDISENRRRLALTTQNQSTHSTENVDCPLYGEILELFMNGLLEPEFFRWCPEGLQSHLLLSTSYLPAESRCKALQRLRNYQNTVIS